LRLGQQQQADEQCTDPNDIFQFDMKNLPVFGLTLFIGRSGGGKSSAMIYCAYYKRHEYDLCVVFCKSVDDAINYSKRVPGAFVFTVWNPAILRAIINMQNENVEKGILTNVLVIIDDFGFDKNAAKDPIMDELCAAGRHPRIGIYWAIQDAIQAGKGNRGQARYVICAPEKCPGQRDRIFEYYNPVFENARQFRETMGRATRDGRQMVMYMMQGSSDRICDNIFWIKPMYPPNWPKFHIPSRKRQRHVWRFDEEWQTKPVAPPTAAGPAIRDVNALRGAVKAAIRKRKRAPPDPSRGISPPRPSTLRKLQVKRPRVA
jgi:hypothetical protein